LLVGAADAPAEVLKRTNKTTRVSASFIKLKQLGCLEEPIGGLSMKTVFPFYVLSFV